MFVPFFFFFLPDRSTHPHEREGDEKRNIKLGWPKGNLQDLLAHSLMNFTSHAIKHRQHSIERDVDLHVVIECLKKMQMLYDQSKKINKEICRIF